MSRKSDMWRSTGHRAPSTEQTQYYVVWYGCIVYMYFSKSQIKSEIKFYGLERDGIRWKGPY